jgi:hypothetical protein
MQYASAIIAKAREDQCTKALVDERELDYKLGILDTFELAQFNASHTT